MTIAEDPREEGRRIVEAADAVHLPLRLIGGIAVAIVAPSIAHMRPVRTYHDIDLVGPARSSAINDLLVELGYEAARRFNALNGGDRLLFHDPSGRRVDIFIERLRMCHTLELGERLAGHGHTVSPADLLLSKLQIVEMTDRDAQDVAALLLDVPLTDDPSGLDRRRLRDVVGRDWGWWRTVDGSLASLVERWTSASASDPRAPILVERARALRDDLASAPRTLGARARGVIGVRRRWYDLPEEVR